MTSKDVDENTYLAQERTKLAIERTRLANERTFLAWVRTGLASVGGGLAISQFLVFRHPDHQLLSQCISVLLVFLGICMFILAFSDFKKSAQKISDSNGHRISLPTITYLVGLLVVIALILLWLVWQRPPLV